MIKINISAPIKYIDSDIITAIRAVIPVSYDEAREYRIIKRTLDASDKSGICYKMSVGLSLDAERERGLLKMRKLVSPYSEEKLLPIEAYSATRPVVVGAGPAGLFAALYLSECGLSPIVLERGLSVDERRKKVGAFFSGGELDPECNIQYGEGGAGAFSDGKLKVGAKDKYKSRVLSALVENGAPEEIIYETNAHVGTDRLPEIVKRIRKSAEAQGAEFIFGARLCGLKTKNASLVGIEYEKGGRREMMEACDLILATGHSARDVFYMLREGGAMMSARPFGVGLRIEHPREYINKIVYKSERDDLPSASYHLVSHLNTGRGVYSFCMCPGGSVVAAASDVGGVVTNGMSPYMRDGENSNAALLVSVGGRDFGSDDPFAGIDFQKRIERAAYEMGGGGYRAPIQLLGDFMKSRKSTALGGVNPTYPIGYEFCPADAYLPAEVTDSIRGGIDEFDKWLSGYRLDSAVLTGAEVRSTSPVCIHRNESYEMPNLLGVYPAGEGAGYAGGIVSSAVDGLKCAEALAKKYKSK